MKNKIIKWYTAAALLLVMSAVLIFFASCSAGHIEDTNGDKTELCSIQMEDIVRQRTNYSSFASSFKRVSDTVTFKAKKFSGVKSILTVNAESDREELVIKSEVTLSTGNLRVVVLQDGEFISDISISGSDTVTIKNPSGKLDIRVAGESAGFEIKIDYSWN